MAYMYVIPIAAVGLSAAFFDDPLTLARVLGGLIVLAGVVLTRIALDRTSAASHSCCHPKRSEGPLVRHR